MTQLLLLLCKISFVLSILPKPRLMKNGTVTRKFEPCQTVYVSEQMFPFHIQEMLQDYHQIFTKQACQFKMTQEQDYKQKFLFKLPRSLKILMYLENLERLYKVESTKDEEYNLQIDENLYVTIKAKNHWGLIRAIETLHQLMDNNKIQGLPIFIQDEPYYQHRGVMVDTSRHFLQVKTLERTIVALMLNKMNILHWHISDDESFPLLLSNHSIITNSTKYKENWYYTFDDVKHIINYASARGVSIVPEIDTPAHTYSWGRNEEFKDQIILCNNKIKQYGQLDPTDEKTYLLVESIFKDIYELFKESPLIHFGGDEVQLSCYDQKPSIKDFMNKNNIKDYVELQTYYRKRQKQIWNTIIKKPLSVAYWYNAVDKLPAEDDDIIQWWGLTSELNQVASFKNRFILSDYNTLYLDTGVGNAFGNSYQTYHTWKQIYKWNPFPPEISGSVIGGETALWGETNNDATNFIKLFIRSSVLADRLWNPHLKDVESYADFVTRLIAMEDRLESYGIGVSPVTHGFCKQNVATCFPVLDGE